MQDGPGPHQVSNASAANPNPWQPPCLLRALSGWVCANGLPSLRGNRSGAPHSSRKPHWDHRDPRAA